MSVVDTHLDSTASTDTRAWRVLGASTFAFTICFAVWMVFAILGIPLKKQLHLSDAEFGLIAATPVLTGSLLRVPLGIWTDRFGGRVVFFFTMAVTVVPIWLIGYATELWQFLVLGLFVGVAGASFSVGTPYVARWFPKSRQGLAMGIFGAGNSGAALNEFVAPVLMESSGRRSSATSGKSLMRITLGRQIRRTSTLVCITKKAVASSAWQLRPMSTVRTFNTTRGCPVWGTMEHRFGSGSGSSRGDCGLRSPEPARVLGSAKAVLEDPWKLTFIGMKFIP